MPSGRRIENARDGLRRVVGVQRQKNQMSGFSGSQDGCDGLGVAHFAHQNHVGILPQNAAERTREIRRVLPHFDLLDDRLPVGMDKLNRVFDRHHMIVAVGVDQIHESGEG